MPDNKRIEQLEELVGSLSSQIDYLFADLEDREPEPVADEWDDEPVEELTVPAGFPSTGNPDKLPDCKPYRAWRNHTGKDQIRTVEVRPRAKTSFPKDPAKATDSTVTIFVAPDGYAPTPRAPAPPAGAIPVTPQGDSVGVPVKNGEAVFVHYRRARRANGRPIGPDSVDAHIADKA